MTSQAVITRYANALVDVLLGPNAGMQSTDAVAQLRSFEAAFSGTSALHTVLASPAVAKARKRAIVRRISEALGLSRIITNFLLVLTDHGRVGALTETIQSVELRLDERSGLVHADVRSAFALTPAQQQALSRELARLAGKQVHTKFVADPDLIGGVTARLGSKLYDGSVRGSLARMQDTLAARV
jgi:F-type H+-transporting ATPase subunit delta